MATMFWVRVAMPETVQAAKSQKLKTLSPKLHSEFPDVLIVSGRTKGIPYLQHDFLPILMSMTRVTKSIILWAHYKDHAGMDITFQTSFQIAWVVGGRGLAKGIKKTCVRCKFLNKQLQGQLMSVLLAQLSVPAPVFSYVVINLVGPFMV